jgi:hypothetical protein
MLNYSKRNPAIFFGRVGEIYIVGWVLTGYLLDCPQNSRLFLPLRPERLHPRPSSPPAAGRFGCEADIHTGLLHVGAHRSRDGAELLWNTPVEP